VGAKREVRTVSAWPSKPVVQTVLYTGMGQYSSSFTAGHFQSYAGE
jgi:hypothetical protein